MTSTWSWRLPSLFQLLFSIVCIVILPFMPESPRWLVYQGRNEEALQVLAQTCAGGDGQSPIVLAQYREIYDTIQYGKNAGETLSFNQMVKTPSVRKRVLLVISCALGTVIVGVYSVTFDMRTVLTKFRKSNRKLVSFTHTIDLYSFRVSQTDHA